MIEIKKGTISGTPRYVRQPTDYSATSLDIRRLADCSVTSFGTIWQRDPIFRKK
jgi:hypothetical protein